MQEGKRKGELAEAVGRLPLPRIVVADQPLPNRRGEVRVAGPQPLVIRYPLAAGTGAKPRTANVLTEIDKTARRGTALRAR